MAKKKHAAKPERGQLTRHQVLLLPEAVDWVGELEEYSGYGGLSRFIREAMREKLAAISAKRAAQLPEAPPPGRRWDQEKG